MIKNLHIAHLTGTATVHENRFFDDIVTFNRPRRSVSQMFFKPYESKKEFIFCSRNTFIPLLHLSVLIFDPLAAALYASIVLGGVAGFLLGAGVSQCMGKKNSVAYCLAVAEGVYSLLCQKIINLLVLPVAITVMATRGLSTGLKAAGLYDYDARHDESQHDEEYDTAQPAFV